MFSTCTIQESRTSKEKMMEDGFIVDLPPEANNTRFEVLSPEGGLRRQVTELIENSGIELAKGIDVSGLRRFIDLDIRRDFTFARFRIYPGKHITQSLENEFCFDVSDGYGVFLDEEGEESSGAILFGGELWTIVTELGAQTGGLQLWKPALSEYTEIPFAS